MNELDPKIVCVCVLFFLEALGTPRPEGSRGRRASVSNHTEKVWPRVVGPALVFPRLGVPSVFSPTLAFGAVAGTPSLARLGLLLPPRA